SSVPDELHVSINREDHCPCAVKVSHTLAAVRVTGCIIVSGGADGLRGAWFDEVLIGLPHKETLRAPKTRDLDRVRQPVACHWQCAVATNSSVHDVAAELVYPILVV